MRSQKDFCSLLSVGELARRAGVPVSTLHFYERKGLIASERTAGNQRRYHRATLRRVAVIRVAQRAGISLADVRSALAELPDGRSPTVEDWQRLSESWKADLEQRIATLGALRDQLATCIGCGCLSLDDCPLRNPADSLGGAGDGPVLFDVVP